MKKIIRNYPKIKNIIANNINNIHNIKKIFVVKFNNKIILLENLIYSLCNIKIIYKQNMIFCLQLNFTTLRIHHTYIIITYYIYSL